MKRVKTAKIRLIDNRNTIKPVVLQDGLPAVAIDVSPTTDEECIGIATKDPAVARNLAKHFQHMADFLEAKGVKPAPVSPGGIIIA